MLSKRQYDGSLRKRRLSRARILAAIRDGEADTHDGLTSLFRLASTPECLELRRTLDEMTAAGLLAKNGIRYKVTHHLEATQIALNISLQELAQLSEDSMIVRPSFGQPSRLEQQIDIFVAMPFSETMTALYQDHIRRVIQENLRFTVARADDLFTDRSIVSDIWSSICAARLVLADCSERNPNVFYEIGVSHAIGKPTLLISRAIEDIPFDIQHLRCLLYEYTPRGMKVFEERLRTAIEGLLGTKTA
jgi:hypothetical protein